MLNLTRQERKIFLFLISMALLGLGVNFAIKANSRIRVVLKADAVAKMNINQASYEDMAGIGDITPKLAKNIIEYRNTQGAFKALEELKEIKGIGDYRYEKLKELFYVE